MPKVTDTKTVTFDFTRSIEYESPSNSDCEEETPLQKAADFPCGIFDSELFHFNEEFGRFRHELRQYENVGEFADIAGLNEHQERCLDHLLPDTAGSFTEHILGMTSSYVDSAYDLVPDWSDWGLIPLIDADLLVALYVHCTKMTKDPRRRGEILADIIIDAFYQYEQYMLPRPEPATTVESDP